MTNRSVCELMARCAKLSTLSLRFTQLDEQVLERALALGRPFYIDLTRSRLNLEQFLLEHQASAVAMSDYIYTIDKSAYFEFRVGQLLTFRAIFNYEAVRESDSETLVRFRREAVARVAVKERNECRECAFCAKYQNGLVDEDYGGEDDDCLLYTSRRG